MRCTGKAPLSPGRHVLRHRHRLVDPERDRSGTVLRVLTYVQPTGQAGETMPMGAVPTSPVDAAGTASDNDASADLVVG